MVLLRRFAAAGRRCRKVLGQGCFNTQGLMGPQVPNGYRWGQVTGPHGPLAVTAKVWGLGLMGSQRLSLGRGRQGSLGNNI